MNQSPEKTSTYMAAVVVYFFMELWATLYSDDILIHILNLMFMVGCGERLAPPAIRPTVLHISSDFKDQSLQGPDMMGISTQVRNNCCHFWQILGLKGQSNKILD